MLDFHSCSTAAISSMQGRARHGVVFPRHIIHASKYKSFSLAVGRYHRSLVRAITIALFAPTPHGIPNLSPTSLVLFGLNPTKHGKCSCSQIPIEFSKKFSYTSHPGRNNNVLSGPRWQKVFFFGKRRQSHFHFHITSFFGLQTGKMA